jgi:hypothetical protein
MKKLLFIFCAFFVFGLASAQSELPENTVVDSLFREDQFYVGLTYNILLEKPSDLSQNGFSTGLQVGFIRDFPISKDRKFAIGLGLGLSTNSYNQNLLINKENSAYTFNVITDDELAFTKNKFYTHTIDVPLELRWRNATPDNYKFWRIYTGIKFSYLFANASKFQGDIGKLRFTNIDVFNKFQYGATLSAGYNTWNFYVYYGLNSIFDNQKLDDGSNLEVSTVKVGFIFYMF